ncbi:lysosomal alpha-mannosidase-like isoform X1 [Ptychodera flava]|uniref:lysosomal alpha-mannosidase-like isoform X1 n=1 Tax=Ptychodera flava TaxID=63121 RepID=UPI003969F795
MLRTLIYTTFILFQIFFVRLTLATCGYESCHPTKADKLNVHLVPHTHDDVGWLKTVDQYFYGANNSIQHAGVQYILDSVIPQLRDDPNKRFIYVEMAFFYRWWRQQSDEMKKTVKTLVEEGRLEFINGGWCMNDEASTHYNAIIDQMTLGLKFLNDTFGECGRPRVAWHIDPFGHSKEQAALFAQMGFDGFYFARLDYADKENRLKDKTMEELWQGSTSLGSVADLFYGALFHHYDAPEGFCFDQFCADDPIQDDPNLFDMNVDEKVKKFLKFVKDQASHFKTNHIILTMGSDFQYENANEWYKNMDKLIKYVNAQEETSGVHVLYSTPSCYTYALNKAGVKWTTKQDDFFPYANAPHSFWTGYFTSRPAIKGYVRQTNNFLQVCKQLDVLSGLQTKNAASESMTLKQAMGVAQHHDAVSGTEKQHVANDYAKRLAIGIQNCQNLVSDSLSSIMSKDQKTMPPTSEFCHYLNISICSSTESQKSFTVTVYNPLARSTNSFVRVPVDLLRYTVTDPDGKTVPTQILDVTKETKRVRGNRGSATHELFFPVSAPALGYSTYLVTADSKLVFQPVHDPSSRSSEPSQYTPRQQSNADTIIKNEYMSLSFDGTTGLLKSITDLESRKILPVSQSFFWYNSSSGNNKDNQPSGAYIFRPNQTDAFPLFKDSVQMHIVQGDLVQEIQQQYTPWVSQVIRLFKGQRHAEFEWTVGPIPFKDGLGKEIICRFDTKLATNKTFYTDANGRQILTRVRNHRDTWQYNDTEPVAGNYYPVNSRIFIKDSNLQLTVLNDRSQGGSSMMNGSLELMVHRRMFWDDHYGVGEALNEPGQFGDGLIARGKMYVLVAPPEKSASLHRDLGEKVYMAPWVSFTPMVSDWSKKFNTKYSALKHELPANVHLLTLEHLENNMHLLRLEHQYEKGEDANMSKPVTVSLQGLFAPFEITMAEEVNLGANQFQKDVKRLHWDIVNGSDRKMGSNYEALNDSLDVELQPFQIRTFRIHVKRG